MKCPHCGHENRVQAKFCEECAARLVRTCAHCGSELSTIGKFCTECGHPMHPGSALQPYLSSPAASTPMQFTERIVISDSTLEGEHRQITVLFADLSGFTRLSTELGAEATHTLLNHYFAAVDKIVEDYGGTVDKHMGDNVMAVFGAPVAHTDDPQRAIRAALDIHRAMESVSKTVRHPLQAHIGIATGQVVASKTGSDTHREYTVTGAAVNLASRLQDIAGPGETYISDAVQRAVVATAISESQGEVEISGLDQPVRVWRLHQLLAEPPADGNRRFVGRRSELAQFAGILAACRETGNGQTVFVRGEAGIGKTRLVEEFQRLAEEQAFACHMSLVLDFGVGRGQDAIRTLVRSLLRIPPESDAEFRAAAADRAVAQGFFSHDRRVYLNDLLDLPQPPELKIVYEAMDNSTRNTGKQEAVAELVRHYSSAQPNLIVVEDIHWADPAALAYLAILAATVMSCAAVLIMTSRTEGDPINQAWRGATGGSPLMTIDLAPLREAEALELAKEYLETSNRFALTCIERAEGNPLFLEQLLRSMEEAGEENVPGSVQSLVQWRMDRLTPPDRTALQAASVLGQRFTLSALQHLIERPQYDCSALVEHFLIRPVGEGFLFAHALVREGVYLSLLRARRRELHRRAAEWFADRDPLLRAQHLDRAETPEAGPAYLEAARAQVGQYDYARAKQLAERALEIAGDGATRYALTCLQGDILRELGESEESIKAFERALQFAADDTQHSKAWIGQAEAMRIVDRYKEALAALDKAEAAAGREERLDQLTRIHFLRGNLYFPLGKIDGCLQQHELALQYARNAGLVEDETRALGGLGDAYYQRGRMITAHKYFRHCVDLSRQHGFRSIEVANLPMVGTSRFYMNELGEALKDALATIERAKKIGHHRAELMGHTGACRTFIQMADLDAAGKHLCEAENLVARLGARRFGAMTLIFWARILRLEGRRLEALKHSEKALIISRETGIGFAGPQVLAELALSTDDRAGRRQALQEGEKILREGAVSHNHFNFYADAMDAYLETNEWDEVERYAAALEEFTRSEPLPWCDFFIARGRTLAAFDRGQRDDSTIQRLRRLRVQAERVGLRRAVPALEVALANT